MIVIGVDPHKQSHTAAAVDAATAIPVADRTAAARRRGYELLLRWARSLDPGRVWALEDCRHVSGGLERFLLARGERVVRVPPKLMAGARAGARARGKSDPLDAVAVARACLREPELPSAQVAGPEREIALLLDHREHLVSERTRIQNRLRWLLHDLEPELEIPAGALDRYCWLDRLEAWLGEQAPAVEVVISAELVTCCRQLTVRVKELERQLARLVRAQAPALLALPGCAVLTAAKLLAEIAGIARFASDAELAMHAGAAPLDASSGQQRRHRLNPFGNRQLNCALHRIAVTQGRSYPPARAYLARKQNEGKSRREALRCLKRHLARVVFRILKTLTPPPSPRSQPLAAATDLT